jgi:hypothetical protein
MRAPSLLLGGMTLTLLSAASLAQTSVDRSFTTVNKSCDGIRWSEAALKEYPNIASACQAVEERNGKTYVKFQGKVDRNINRGKQVAVNFKDGSTLTLSPPENMQVYVDGRKTSVANLQRGDELNFYVPEDRFAAQFAQDETPQPQFVAVPIMYRETYSETTPERSAANLPATASDLPFSALGGFMLLGLGGALSLRRLGKR